MPETGFVTLEEVHQKELEWERKKGEILDRYFMHAIRMLTSRGNLVETYQANHLIDEFQREVDELHKSRDIADA